MKSKITAMLMALSVVSGLVLLYVMYYHAVDVDLKNRYTESRITSIARSVLGEVGSDSVIVVTNNGAYVWIYGDVYCDSWNNLINYYDTSSGFVLASAGNDEIKGTKDDIAIKYNWTNSFPWEYYLLTFVGEFTGAYEGEGGGPKVRSWQNGSKRLSESPSFEWMGSEKGLPASSKEEWESWEHPLTVEEIWGTSP
jgi:hypothetical protein